MTWCTKDKNGAPPVAAAQPYTLWRYTGSACSWHRDEMGVESRGQDRRTEHLRRQDLQRRPRSGRVAHSGVDGWDIGRRDVLLRRSRRCSSSGAEVPGARRVGDARIRADQPDHRQLVGLPGSDLVQRVRPGRQRPAPAEERHAARRTSTPGRPSSTRLARNLADASQRDDPCRRHLELQLGCEHDRLRARPAPSPAPARRSTSFTGCTGGQAGQYPQGMPVYSASSARPPRATLSVSLPLDKTPASTSQRFVLIDNIVLRNSQPF